MVQDMKRWHILSLAMLPVLLAGCDGGPGIGMHTSATPARFASNGERIYFTGASESGKPITYEGGNMHLRMMGGGCATCHGAARDGLRMMPELWLTAPPLTADALFGAHDQASDHGDHSAYTPDRLRTAISRGTDPHGDNLDPVMPRWSMSEADWSDLLAYLSR